MKNDKFLESVFAELSLIKKKMEDFISSEKINLNKNEEMFLELIDKRSCELACLTGEIERLYTEL